MSMAMMLILSATMISMTCVIAAVMLLLRERKGWGWFLLVAFLVAASADSGTYIHGVGTSKAKEVAVGTN